MNIGKAYTAAKKRNLTVLSQIGEGSYSTAYMLASGKVLVVSIDPVKRLMTSFPASQIFPKVKFLFREAGYNFFLMDYLGDDPTIEEIRELSDKQLQFFAALGELHNSCKSITGLKGFHKNLRIWMKDFPKEQRAILKAAEIVAAACPDFSFEAQVFNLRIVKGKVVLMDCFFPNV